ncbi:MAG: aminodeoxychorismate synthase component I [Nocardioidaceae bacterium]
MPTTLLRRRIDCCLDPTQMLRVLRDKDGLFGLVGGWHDSRAVVGFDPVRRLAQGADPFAAVSQRSRPAGAAGFGGGWVGVFGYQLGGRLENLPPPPPRPVPLPLFSLAYYDHVLVRDGEGWWFEALVDDADPDLVKGRLEVVEGLLRGPLAAPSPYTCSDFVARPDAAGHRTAVRTTLGHLVAGDVYQANVCRRFEAGFSGDPLDVFCAGVEGLSPSYAAFLRTPEGAIASFSPELFLRRTERRVRSSPIKGTAPLASDVERLVASAKDRAENVMIVDLMRNDLGRVCVPGSVRVEDIARAERRTGVWHLVSDVVGTLAPGEDDASLLRATFPPGSVTGAPKVRAMQLIHEVEQTARETYTGAVGYVSPGAGLELNVAIRTFEFAGDRVWLGAGGGVVVDSTPHGELVETLVKAAPLLAAIGARLCPEDGRDLLVSKVVPRIGESDGHPEPRTWLPPVDRGAGLFTTCLVDDGTVVDLDRHLARLSASVADCYGEALPPGLARQATTVGEALRGKHRLHIGVRPGPEGLRSAEVTATPIAPGRGKPLRLVPVVVPGGMGDHKYGDRRRLTWLEPAPGVWSAGCDALVMDTDGAVLETGRGNLFIVTDDAVHTPALDGRLLPGVTRGRVVDALEGAGVAVVQRRLTLDDVVAAGEVFVTSSLSGVRPVVSVDGVGCWDVGRTTSWLAGRPRPPAAGATASVAWHSGSRTPTPTLLVVDNYDSFVYNLDQYVRELGAQTHVVRNDGVDIDEVVRSVAAGRLQGILISPGPGRPADAGASTALVERLAPAVPILGICLGHQCIAELYGGRVVPVGTVVHGKPSLVHHDGSGVFAGLEGPLVAARYHSLVVSVEGLPPDLMVTACTAEGVVMGLRHREYDVEGVQFHPESILSRHGHHLLANFLSACEQATTGASPRLTGSLPR